mmetsp:Transcript_48620/g.105461  ORF Transcript_48620/g.105461 Transcript_48620/m.105461 type:complete len:370 (+) Transcript_48620:891-2000(+)
MSPMLSEPVLCQSVLDVSVPLRHVVPVSSFHIVVEFVVVVLVPGLSFSLCLLNRSVRILRFLDRVLPNLLCLMLLATCLLSSSLELAGLFLHELCAFQLHLRSLQLGVGRLVQCHRLLELGLRGLALENLPFDFLLGICRLAQLGGLVHELRLALLLELRVLDEVLRQLDLLPSGFPKLHLHLGIIGRLFLSVRCGLIGQTSLLLGSQLDSTQILEHVVTFVLILVELGLSLLDLAVQRVHLGVSHLFQVGICDRIQVFLELGNKFVQVGSLIFAFTATTVIFTNVVLAWSVVFLGWASASRVSPVPCVRRLLVATAVTLNKSLRSRLLGTWVLWWFLFLHISLVIFAAHIIRSFRCSLFLSLIGCLIG